MGPTPVTGSGALGSRSLTPAPDSSRGGIRRARPAPSGSVGCESVGYVLSVLRTAERIRHTLRQEWAAAMRASVVPATWAE